MKRIFLSLFMSLLGSVCALWAQTAHWQCNPHDYEYDMTVYVSLCAVSDLSNYEIAAFCGDECRGVAEVITAGTSQIGYLRIRSNSASGDNITFKVYDKTTDKEFEIDDAHVIFQSNATQGVPSAPFVLRMKQNLMPGDVDGDGEVTINDVIMTINASLGNPSDNFNFAAADVDEDNEITINDVIMIINITLQD